MFKKFLIYFKFILIYNTCKRFYEIKGQKFYDQIGMTK